jgi:hypothetical protein
MCHFHTNYQNFTATPSLAVHMTGICWDSISYMAYHHITVTFRIEMYFSLLYNASHNMMIAVRFLSFLFCQLVFLRCVFKNPTIDFNALFNSLGNSTCSSPEVVLACLLYEGSTIQSDLYAPTSNSCIFTPIEDWAHICMAYIFGRVHTTTSYNI